MPLAACTPVPVHSPPCGVAEDEDDAPEYCPVQALAHANFIKRPLICYLALVCYVLYGEADASLSLSSSLILSTNPSWLNENSPFSTNSSVAFNLLSLS